MKIGPTCLLGWDLPTYEDETVCSKTSAYKIQTPGNYPEESIQQHVIGLMKHHMALNPLNTELNPICQ